MKVNKTKSLIAVIGSSVIAVASPATATDLTGTTAYRGTIKAVILGYFGQVGVSLADGFSCNGQQQVLLLSDNPKYNEILSALLTAQINQSQVALAQPAANPRNSNGFCTISEVSLGQFPGWP